MQTAGKVFHDGARARVVATGIGPDDKLVVQVYKMHQGWTDYQEFYHTNSFGHTEAMRLWRELEDGEGAPV